MHTETTGHPGGRSGREVLHLGRESKNNHGKLLMVGLLDMKGDESIRRVYDEEGLCPTLTTMGGGHREPKVLVRAINDPNRLNKSQNGRRIKTNDEPMFTLTVQDVHGVVISNGEVKKREDETSTCLTATYYKGLDNHGSRTGIMEETAEEVRIRKLTPLECWRLQGFPDWAHQRAVDAGVSNSQRYKQSGNSVTVPVIAAIAGNLT